MTRLTSAPLAPIHNTVAEDCVGAAYLDPVSPDDCPIPSPFRDVAPGKARRRPVDADQLWADLDGLLVTIKQALAEADALLARHGADHQAGRDVAAWRALLQKAEDDLTAAADCCPDDRD
jgi:hypothetical protein